MNLSPPFSFSNILGKEDSGKERGGKRGQWTRKGREKRTVEKKGEGKEDNGKERRGKRGEEGLDHRGQDPTRIEEEKNSEKWENSG